MPEHGKVTGAASGASYPYGAVVDLVVTPDAGHELRGWTGAAASCGRAPACRIVIDRDVTVSVRIGSAADRAGAGDGGGDRDDG